MPDGRLLAQQPCLFSARAASCRAWQPKLSCRAPVIEATGLACRRFHAPSSLGCSPPARWRCSPRTSAGRAAWRLAGRAAASSPHGANWPDPAATNGPRLDRGYAFRRASRKRAHGRSNPGGGSVCRNNRPIAGATIRVQSGGRTLTRFAKSGASYLSSSDPRILVGLGPSAKVDKVSVQWPWESAQEWTGLASDTYYRLKEGEPAAERQSAAGSLFRQ